ncbi:hypothetical protein FQN54_005916 [Arachnomyces sp. PD_36]|nr:hypothetical protein FQN54_005916 [Arachnomyces sp. PD_36]
MDDCMIGLWVSELPMSDPSNKSWWEPLLRRFVNHDKAVQYLELLGEGGEGIVYRVKIEGMMYALKIFSEWEYTGAIPIPEHHEPYISPFANECRAFARLDSMGENGTWAVKCHGWMKLSDDQFRPIRRGNSGVSRWAIVKDYLSDPVQISDVPEIRRKMCIAYQATIHPSDILPRNYRGSFLVDLGRARTYPYVKRFWSNRAFESCFTMFDETIEEWEIDDEDGSVVMGGTNEKRKRFKAMKEQRKMQIEEQRGKSAPTPSSEGHGNLLAVESGGTHIEYSH